MASALKIQHLEALLHPCFEPLDVIDKLPSLSGSLTEEGGRIQRIQGSDPASRKKRVDIFIELLEEEQDREEENGGNILQEFVDVLKTDETHRWLVPFLTDDCDCSDLLQRLGQVEKPEKLRYILNVIFPALKDIQLSAIISHLRGYLSDRDREQLEAAADRHGNTHSIYILLNKLVIKQPTWIDSFIEGVRDLNYSATTDFFTKDSPFSTLEEALRSFFEPLSEGDPASMEVSYSEDVDMGNESAPPFAPTKGVSLSMKKCHIRDEQKQACCESMETDTSRISKSPLETQESAEKWKLRGYQEELCKAATIGENVIICAPTGSGKTLMAAKIIEKHISQVSNAKVIFFTPTGGLAQQQFRYMEDYLPKTSKVLLHGNLDGASNDDDMRKKIYSVNLIVMTPQILLNCFKKKQVRSIFDFTLLIFDECHHAHHGDPYNEILLHHYMRERSPKYGSSGHLQIIGLTATLGIGDAGNLEEAKKHIFMLLGSMDATGGISMVRESKNCDELNKSCPKPQERYIKVKKDIECPFKNCIQKAIGSVVDVLAKTGAFSKFSVDHPNGTMSDMVRGLQWCSKLQRCASQSSDENGSTLSRDVTSCCEAIKALFEGLDLFLHCRPTDTTNSMRCFIIKHYEDEEEKNTKVENMVHDILKITLLELNLRCKDPECQNKKLSIIEENVSTKVKEDPESRSMIMVQRRIHAEKLTEWMNESDTLRDLNAKKFTGVGKKNSSMSSGTSHSEQRRVIEDFNQGQSKVMICTPDAAGEGIDIQGCNLVVTNDCIGSETSKVQTTGRARKAKSDVVSVSSTSAETQDMTKKKVMLMEKATREINKMYLQKKEEYEHKLKVAQREAVTKFNAALEKKRTATARIQDLSLRVCCRKCTMFICNSSHVVKVNRNHHTVDRHDFASKFTKFDHPMKDKLMDGVPDMMHAYKIKCVQCKHEWGNLVRWKGCLVPVLKIKAVKFTGSKRPITPKTWKKAPLSPRDVEFHDISHLLSYE